MMPMIMYVCQVSNSTPFAPAIQRGTIYLNVTDDGHTVYYSQQ
jgi:hypothetical protein